MKGFKDFLMQGNLIELATAVIMAGAFGKVVEAFTKIIMDLIAKVAGGEPNFDAVAVGGVNVGVFITALISFIMILLSSTSWSSSPTRPSRRPLTRA